MQCAEIAEQVAGTHQVMQHGGCGWAWASRFAGTPGLGFCSVHVLTSVANSTSSHAPKPNCMHGPPGAACPHHPQDVLLYHGATQYGSGPTALGTRSPRNSFDPASDTFSRERGSYQHVMEHP